MVARDSKSFPTEGDRKREELQRKAAFRRDRIRAVMRHKGWSQAEWCKLAGIENPTTLGNFLAENGRGPKSLNLDTLEPLAKAADFTVGQLIGEQPFPWEQTVGDQRPPQLQTVIVELPAGVRVIVETHDPLRFVQSLLPNQGSAAPSV